MDSTRDVGWVYWSVAMHYANKFARQNKVRYRVRKGRDGGWVAEPAYHRLELKSKHFGKDLKWAWLDEYSKERGGLSGGSCRGGIVKSGICTCTMLNDTGWCEVHDEH